MFKALIPTVYTLVSISGYKPKTTLKLDAEFTIQETEYLKWKEAIEAWYEAIPYHKYIPPFNKNLRVIT